MSLLIKGGASTEASELFIMIHSYFTGFRHRGEINVPPQVYVFGSENMNSVKKKSDEAGKRILHSV